MTSTGNRPPPRPDPWERQSHDTDASWRAFVVYRDMGPERSLSKAARELSKSKQVLQRWSPVHSWTLRAAAWDREQEREWQNELRVARRKAAERNVKTSRTAMIVAGNALADLAQNPQKMKPGDIARLMEVASKLEALALGSPTDRVAVSHGGQADAHASREHVGSLGDEDRLARLAHLHRELGNRLQRDPNEDREPVANG